MSKQDGERTGMTRDQQEEKVRQDQALTRNINRIRHRILVLSGKGGVGKSTVAANLALSLSLAGKRVGLLDIDIHGPSIPKLLGLEGRRVEGDENGIIPVQIGKNLFVISIAFLLPSEDSPVIWRGPMKYNVIRQFLSDVSWGDLDYLIVDSPPGTGDEPLAIAQLIAPVDGAVIVTTPQKLAINDVRKSVNFCRQVDVPILGIIENMSGMVCPHCGENIDIFSRGGGEQLAQEMNEKFLGRIPFDAAVVSSSDDGKPFIYQYSQTETAKAFGRVIRPILELDTPIAKGSQEEAPDRAAAATGVGRIAIPTRDGALTMHFGHADTFTLFDVNFETGDIISSQDISAPPHEPGLLPRWLREQGATGIIACGMGIRARNLFEDNGITVTVGVQPGPADKIIRDFLGGTMESGDNICDH